jgi:Protein of unknown function (DUF3300)
MKELNSRKQSLIIILIAITMLGFPGAQLSAAPISQTTPQDSEAVRKTPAELQQLVAPIALYPDALVAQILAACTYPTEVAEADRWLQRHTNIQGEQLATEVNRQSWDPSVKALTAFPPVLANLDKNLSWTSALGEAYFDQQQDVLDAVQVMRRQAQSAGNLQSTPQENVIDRGPTIVIEPVNADVCYLPSYNPWLVYGSPIVPYPGYLYDPWFGPPFIAFGPGIRLGFFGGYFWGWPAWGFDWGRRVVVFNHSAFVPRGPFFFHRFDRDRFRFGRNGAFDGNHGFRGFDRNRINGNGKEFRSFGEGPNLGNHSETPHSFGERNFGSRSWSHIGRGSGFGGGRRSSGALRGGGRHR